MSRQARRTRACTAVRIGRPSGAAWQPGADAVHGIKCFRFLLKFHNAHQGSKATKVDISQGECEHEAQHSLKEMPHYDLESTDILIITIYTI